MDDDASTRLALDRRTLLGGVSALAFGTALGLDTAGAAAGDYAAVRDAVRLTPRPAATDVGGARSLSGTWSFQLAASEAPPDGGDWRDEPVPGQWDYGGVGGGEWYPPEGHLGWYRRDVAVPAAWDGGRVLLRFEAVYSRARVFVDGEQVADHVGGYTPFEVDVTASVTAGETSTVAVGVAQRSAADDMAWQNVTGGIPRDVALVGVPEAHLADVTVTSTLADDGASATVGVDATVRNDGDASLDGGTVSATLTGPDGSTVGTASADVPAVPAGETGTATLEVDVDDPATWTPETPRLHEVDVDLQAGGTSERVTERVGIRTVAVAGDELRLNGTPVTLRGVNWEEIHVPEHGHAVPPALTREDARRLKAANVNYVRTAHHPTSAAFLDACDEFGVVVEVEAPHTFVGRNGGGAVPDVVVRQCLEMVEGAVNHPSVCVWSLANESSWHDVFADAARLVHERDGTRPLIFNTDVYEPAAGYHDQFALGAHHYPAFRSGSTVEQHANAERPMLYGEFGHTYCYNDRELATDPGLREQWGWLFDRVWERIRATDAAGAALWAGGDHLERWGEYRWGILDRYRRPRPEYWHVKQTFSPVRVVDAEWAADESSVTVTVENRHAFVSLAARTVETASDGERTTHELAAAPGETEPVTVPVPGDAATLTVAHPLGHAVTQERLAPPTSPPAPPEPADDASVDAGEETIEVAAGDWVLTVDRDTGSVTFGPAGGDPVLVDTPSPAVTEPQAETGLAYDAIIDHRTFHAVTGVELLDGGAGVRLEAAGGVGAVTHELRPVEGGLEITYEIDVTAPVPARELGLTLPVASGTETLAWDRQSLWTVYPAGHVGRPAGTAEAFRSGSRPADAAVGLRADQPWAADTTTHGSNDFRSTKRHVESATLTDGDGRGLRIVSDGSQHVRAQVRDDRVDLLVLERSISGTNAAGWMNRHPAAGEDTAVAGTVEGSVTLLLEGDASGGSGPSTAPTSGATATPDRTPSPTGTEPGGGGVPGFTAELALAALAGLAALAAHRAD